MRHMPYKVLNNAVISALWSISLLCRQNMVEVWSRTPSEQPAVSKAARPGEGSAERAEKRVEEQAFREQPRPEQSAAEEEDMCFVYPVLQPAPVAAESGGDGEGSPWAGAGSKGFLRFSVFFANPFNRLVINVINSLQYTRYLVMF